LSRRTLPVWMAPMQTTKTVSLIQMSGQFAEPVEWRFLSDWVLVAGRSNRKCWKNEREA
jgi:hypothetical protein